MTLWVYTLLIVLKALLCQVHATGVQDVCSSNQFSASCDTDEILVIDEAQYGRMEGGRCGVTSEGGDIGCSNDIMYLVDDKCSGKRECSFIVGTDEFYEANTQCNKELRAYLRISYSCVKVAFQTFAQCLSQSRVEIRSHEGFISSHVTDETGCGSMQKPWSISAMPGQTVNLAIMDFGALSRGHASRTGHCRDVYGYVVERALTVNDSICAGTERRRNVYSSTSNHIEINVLPQNHRRDDSLFLLHYKVIGCSDLTPPAHAWYKRDDHIATIGCAESETKWELTCRGNSWEGVVGNCSAKPVIAADTDKSSILGLPVNTLLIVAAISGATIVLAILIIVAGVICVKKYRHDREARADSLPGTLVYQIKRQPGESPPRGQYHPMTLSHGQPGGSTMAGASNMGSIHHTCTVQGRGRAPMSPATPTLLATGRRSVKQGAPPPPSYRLAPGAAMNAPQHTALMHAPPHRTAMNAPSNSPPHLPGQSITSTGVSRAGTSHPLWAQPVPEDQIQSDGIYQNPDEVISTTIQPTRSQGGAGIDPDDISSYYAPSTGHKYFILERQPEQQNESHS